MNPTKTISLTTLSPEDCIGMRLDQALAKLFPDYSRSKLQDWIRHQQVWVDGKILKAKDKLTSQHRIEITAELSLQAHWQPQAIALDIVFSDPHIIILNKPPGLVVHPAAGNPDQTLLNALLYFAPELALLPRAGIVHRLDKDTSGLMVIARTLEAHTQLVTQIHDRQIKREYVAIVTSLLTGGGTINAPIGRHPTQRTRMAIVSDGKTAITHYRLIKRFRAHSYVRVLLETGRTHQIRVHFAHKGYPLIGDPTYGGRLKIPPQCSPDLKEALLTFKRQALHAERLTLHHPVTLELMSWHAPIPKDLNDLLGCLEQDAL